MVCRATNLVQIICANASWIRSMDDAKLRCQAPTPSSDGDLQCRLCLGFKRHVAAVHRRCPACSSHVEPWHSTSRPSSPVTPLHSHFLTWLSPSPSRSPTVAATDHRSVAIAIASPALAASLFRQHISSVMIPLHHRTHICLLVATGKPSCHA